MSTARDLDTLLDLTPDELSFLAELPANLANKPFTALVAEADRVARSRAGLEAVMQGVHPQTPTSELNELQRLDFRLRTWWSGIISELRRRCECGRAEP